MNIFMLNILKTTSLSTLFWLESKFYSGTLPTMHSIYVYTDIYQGLKIFQTAIYIYICVYTLWSLSTGIKHV